MVILKTPLPAQPQEERVAIDVSEEEALPILQKGEIIGGQRIPWGSNYTFLVHIDAGPGRYLRGIYKPRDGERPLDDFPAGSLFEREYGAFLLARSLGWPAIPLTLVRDGPYGTGAMQLYVESDPNVTYFELIGERADSLMPFAVFDVVANNADRKAGHCLLGDLERRSRPDLPLGVQDADGDAGALGQADPGVARGRPGLAGGPDRVP